MCPYVIQGARASVIKSRETFGFGISREKQRGRKRGNAEENAGQQPWISFACAKQFYTRLNFSNVVSVFSGLASEFIGRRFASFE